jgi:hypothetical protein
MKKYMFFAAMSVVTGIMQGQFAQDSRTISGPLPQVYIQNPGTRSVSKPTTCGSDTSYFTRNGTTAYNGVTIRSGSSLGQYFGTNQEITVSGFRFHSYSLSVTPARPVNIRVICHLYKAGLDSLPSGSPLASDTITVDTVMGASIGLDRIERNAVFKKAVKLNYDYIITVGTDSTAVSAAIITNSWTAGNGKKKNLGCGSVSGKWYRCLQLNIAGVTFDADMQFYPFVSYKMGSDFAIANDCYNFGDTVKFNNKYKENVSGSDYYNYYKSLNIDYFTQRWSYDGSAAQYYVVDGFYKPFVKKNFEVRLISVLYGFSGGICYDTAIKTVYFKPNKPSIKPSRAACKGDTLLLNVVTETGVVYKWYRKQSDPSPFYTGNSLEIKNAQLNDTFYIQADNGGCKSAFTRYDFVVSAYPKDPIVKNDSICSGAIANLSASSSAGRIEWYKDKVGGLMLFTGLNFQSDKLYSDTGFFVQANNNGCLNKGGRVGVKASVGNNFAPALPKVIMDTFVCLRPATSLHIGAYQSGSDTIRWFSTGTGGVPIHRGDSLFVSLNKRGDFAYYVETWNGVCGSGRTEVIVHAYDYPNINYLGNDTVCKGEDAFPVAYSDWGTLSWYGDAGGKEKIFEGYEPTINQPSRDSILYIQSSEEQCVSPGFTPVYVVVNSAPVPSSVVANAVCSKAAGVMTVQISQGKVNWYYDPLDANPFFTGKSVNTGLLLGGVTYYYQTENKGCISEKTPLSIAVKPRPTAGFTWTLQWKHRLVCTPITTAGMTIAWEWGDGTKSTGAPYAHQYANAGQYTVRMIATSSSNGCKDTADIPVNIDHTGLADLSSQGLQLYPVPATAGSSLVVQGIEGAGLRYEVYTVSGMLVGQGKLEDGALRLHQNWMPGTYFLKVEGAHASGSGTFVIVE